MKMRTNIAGDGVTIEFDDKPSAEIRSILKANGFSWQPVSRVWWRRRVQGAADLIGALDKRLHPGRPDGRCWLCNDPDGFFRPQGAATPVYCNGCHRMLTNPQETDRWDLLYEDRHEETCEL